MFKCYISCEEDCKDLSLYFGQNIVMVCSTCRAPRNTPGFRGGRRRGIRRPSILMDEAKKQENREMIRLREALLAWLDDGIGITRSFR